MVVGVWAANDTISAAKLNQKQLFVGTADQIGALTPTVGQMVYSLSTNASFTKDHFYVRSTAAAWVDFGTNASTVTENAETSTGQLTTTNTKTLVDGTRYYVYFTITVPPTANGTYSISITGLEYNINTLNNGGSIHMGVDVVESTNPSITSTPLVCVTMEAGQASGTNRFPTYLVSPNIIRVNAGSGQQTFGAWIRASKGGATAAVLGGLTISSTRVAKAVGAYTYAVNDADNTSWTADVWQPYIKIYYRTYT